MSEGVFVIRKLVREWAGPVAAAAVLLGMLAACVLMPHLLGWMVTE